MPASPSDSPPPDTRTGRTAAVPLLPLTSGVLLPGMVVTVMLETHEARVAAEAAGREGSVLVVPRLGTRYALVGVLAAIEDTGRLRNGTDALVLRGVRRAKVRAGVPGTGDATWVETEPAREVRTGTERTRELAREYRATVEETAEARGQATVAELLQAVSDPGALADMAGYDPDLSVEQKVEVLEALDVEERLQKVLTWARETLAEVVVKDRIHEQVRTSLDRHQREAILREQLNAVRRELRELTGEHDDDDLVEEYRRRIADAGMPEEARVEAERELARLERTPQQSPEHGWLRTYLDWMTDLPWSVRTEDDVELQTARRVLDEDHTGLEEVKARIVEHLAVRKLRLERAATGAGSASRGHPHAGASGAILTLVGPPGVGKTSLGASVARALGRRFVRIALGGIHDEAEIRGHRRTYVGALPGRIVRALKEAGTKNPVVVLDEIDKVGADWRGDPTSALLEVLDPAQNHTFRDHYLDVDLDLSDVLFIATGNVAESIPGPLLDRMEVIRIDGYTEDEKVAIARDHLLPRQLERNGLRAAEVVITDAALQAIVREHTREAGVRNLERELGKLLRKAATDLVQNEVDMPVEVDAHGVPRYLGRRKHFLEAADRTGTPGVATGLAATGAGGDVLFIEAAAIDGEPGFVITGQLGEVMQESARIALSYVQAHAAHLGVSLEATRRRFHLHVPAGAVPKDGPSAGVTMAAALVSLLTGRSVRAGVGMTGELTLQGRVLPVGGVKQKVLAAHRAGLHEVVVPARNAADLEDVPAEVREAITFHAVERVDEILERALEPSPRATAAV